MRGLALINYMLALPGITLAIIIHEYFKASISYKLGDPYPKLHGRLRIGIRNHLEPIGFLLMLLYGYGWGMPVKTTDIYYKDRKRGTLIAYIAPALINLLFAFTFYMLLLTAKQVSYALGYNLPFGSRGFAQGIQGMYNSAYNAGGQFSGRPAVMLAAGAVYQIVYLFVRCNLSVALINLIPVYPLDGSAILEICLPPGYRYAFGRYKGILLIALLLLFIFGFVNAMLDPAVMFFLKAVV